MHVLCIQAQGMRPCIESFSVYVQLSTFVRENQSEFFYWGNNYYAKFFNYLQ